MAGRIVNPQAVEALRVAIDPLNTYERRTAYRNGDFPRADRVKNLDARYRWDLFWLVAGMDILDQNGVDTLHVENTHIETALRSVVDSLDLFTVVGGITMEGGEA